MKTEIKKVGDNKSEISVEIGGDIVKNKFEEVFKKIAKDAKVKGFRQGNAPRDILEKQYSSFAHEQVLKELVPDAYNQAIGKEGLDVVGMPDIADVKLERDSLSFKATVEVSPEIKIKDYKGIKVGGKKIEVSPDEIKRGIDSLKESKKADNADDAFAWGLGYPSLLELEKYIETQLYIQKQNQERKKREDQIIGHISKGLNFNVPQSMVNRQLEELLRQAKLEMALKGLPPDKIDEREKSLVQELTPVAQQQVRIYLILSEIAKKENIPQDDHMPSKVMELLLREADWKEEGGN